MERLESKSILNFEPEAGISSLPDSDCSSRFSGFFVGDSIMKRIPLTQGKSALVDDEDYLWLRQWKWYANTSNGHWYAHRQYRSPVLKNKKGYSKQVLVMMHRQILGSPKGKNVDHINHNGLDNQKSNLRLCTQSQNCQNQRVTKGRRYKGVSCQQGSKYQVNIMYNGVNINLGRYTVAKAAAKEYDKLAKILFGEFACLNFPDKKG